MYRSLLESEYQDCASGSDVRAGVKAEAGLAHGIFEEQIESSLN
jgi:hypothetical protein